MVQKLTSGSFNIIIFLTLKRSFWAGPAERTEEARASSAAASRVAAGAAAARRRHFPLSPSRPASFREEAGTGAARTVPATGGAGEGRGPTMQPERGGSRPRREGGRHGRRRPGGAEKAAEPATESGGADGTAEEEPEAAGEAALTDTEEAGAGESESLGAAVQRR